MTPATVPADEAFHDAPWFLALGRLTGGAGWTGHDAARRYMRKHNLRVLTKACVDAVLAAIPQRKRRLVVGALLVTGLWVETPDSGGYELRLHPDAAALDAALQQEEARRTAQRAYERDRKAAQRARKAGQADPAQAHGADLAPQQTPTTTPQDAPEGADVPVGQPVAVPADVPEAVPDASLSLSSLSDLEINPEREREISPEPRASAPEGAGVPVGQPVAVPVGQPDELPPPASMRPTPQAWPADIEQVAGHHRARFGVPTTPGDRAVVRSRLLEGYTALQLCCAIDGADVDGYYRRIRRTSLAFLLDAKRVADLIARGTPPELQEPPASCSPSPSSVVPVASSSVRPGWPTPPAKLPRTMPGDSFPGADRNEPLLWAGGLWAYEDGLWHLFGRDPNAKRGAG